MTPEQIRDYVYPGVYGSKAPDPCASCDTDQVCLHEPCRRRGEGHTGNQVHGAMPPDAGAQLEGHSFGASLTREPLVVTGRPVDNITVTSCEAQPRAWERGTFGEPGYKCYNGDVFVDPPPEGFRPVYGRDCPEPSEQESIFYRAPNGDTIEEPDYETFIPELRTPIAWNIGPDDWCYGSTPPAEREWEPVYYAGELPKRPERYTGAVVGWVAIIALVAGCFLGHWLSPHMFGSHP